MKLAVFLLAGRGSRLKRYTEIIPKCLVEVSGKPILIRMLEILRRVGVNRVILVVGYKWEQIYQAVGDQWNGISIDYVNNTDWESTNNIVSFYMARDIIDDDFFLIEGDIVIADNALDQFVARKNQMAVSAFKPFMNGTVVTLDPHKNVEKIILKSDFTPELDLSQTYKTVNIYSLNKSDFHSKTVPALEQIIGSGKVNSYYEQAFAHLVNNSLMKFEAIDYSETDWYEVDNEDDLVNAEAIFIQ